MRISQSAEQESHVRTEHVLEDVRLVEDNELELTQEVLDGYLKNADLLGELRFWMANQGVAMNVIGNTRKLDMAILAKIRAAKESR